jgi:hypothetical protein
MVSVYEKQTRRAYDSSCVPEIGAHPISLIFLSVFSKKAKRTMIDHPLASRFPTASRLEFAAPCAAGVMLRAQLARYSVRSRIGKAAWPTRR